MFIFIIIFLLLITWSLNIIGNAFNKKYTPILFLFSFFGMFQLTLSPLTSSQIISINFYKIIFLIELIIICISTISLMLYFCIKNKNLISLIKLNLTNNLIIPCATFISWVIACLFLTLSDSIYSDTTAYQGISNFFKSGIYSFNGINTLSSYYSNTTQYFVYSLYDGINIGYYFINPLVVIMFGSLLFQQIFKSDSKLSTIIFCLFLIAIPLMYIPWSYLASSGNLLIQSLSFVGLYLLIKDKQFFMIPLMYLMLNFFSITGSIIYVVGAIISCFYLLICGTTKNKYISMIPITSLLFIVIFPFVKFNTFSLLWKVISILFIYFSQIGLWTLWLFINRKYKLDQNESIIKINANKDVVIGVLIISVISSIFFPLYIILFYSSNFFPKYQVFGNLVFNLFLMSYLFYLLKTKKHINPENIFLSLCTIFVLIFMVITNTLNSSGNQSIWRIIYCSPMMGNLQDVVLFSIIFVINILHELKITNKYQKKINITFNFLYSSTFIVSASLANVYVGASGVVTNFSYSSNVQQNINKFSKADESFLKELNSKINKSDKVMATVPYQIIINKGINISNDVINNLGFEGKINLNPWLINTYGIIGGIQDYVKFNGNYHDEQIYLNMTDNDYLNAIKSTNANYFILNKKEFNYNPSNSIYNGDNIIVFHSK